MGFPIYPELILSDPVRPARLRRLSPLHRPIRSTDVWNYICVSIIMRRITLN